MGTRTTLGGLLLLAAGFAPTPAVAQEHPARRVATIVSVAVEEYGKAVDAKGKLISAQEYQETTDFLADASRAAERLSGETARPARALLDSITTAVSAKRPPAVLDSLEARFATLLGSEAKLELPAGTFDVAAGRAIYERSCASCHGPAGAGDGPAAAGMHPAPPPIGTVAQMHGVSPAMMYRIVSIGIAGSARTIFRTVEMTSSPGP